jgi:hypothetical protein
LEHWDRKLPEGFDSQIAYLLKEMQKLLLGSRAERKEKKQRAKQLSSNIEFTWEPAEGDTSSSWILPLVHKLGQL